VPGTRGFLGTGVGSTVDPKIDTLNIRLRLSSQGGSPVPEDRSQSRRTTCQGLCDIWLEADSCSHGESARRSGHSGSQLGNCVPFRLLLEEGGARTRRFLLVRSTEVVRYRVLKLRQQPQIRWCWRRWACSSPRAIRRYPLAETASRLDTWERCLSIRLARGPTVSTPVVTRRHDDQVCVFNAP